MNRYSKSFHKSLVFILAFLLTLSCFPVTSMVTAVSPESGEILVDKHRSNYELDSGESTNVTLSIQTNNVTVKPPKDIVITIDVSNSVNDNSVLASTKTAAKSLVNQVLGDGSGSRVALVRYGDYASVYNFSTSQWIVLDAAGTIEGLSGSAVYSSNLSAITTRIDNIRNNVSSGYFVFNTSDSWDNGSDQGGTTTEAGIYVTTEVAKKHTNTSYTIFMSDGVPTSRQIGLDKGANGLYGITRDGAGDATSAAEKSEAIAKTTALKAASTSFSVAVTSGLSSTKLTDARDVMKAVASDPDKYFETNNPSADFNNIYLAIATSIVTTVAKNAYVEDIVPAYYTVSNLPAGVTSANGPNGTKILTWTIGDLVAGTISMTYTLTLKPGYYGIVDTNQSAILYYTNHALGAGDPNTLADRTFPIPEIKAQLKAVNDSYTTPNNTAAYLIPASILANDPNVKIDNAPYDLRTALDLTPASDRNVQGYAIEVVTPLGAEDGTISGFNLSTGFFTYTPNSSRLADPGLSTYTVNFTYKLVSTDAGKAYQSNVATVTIIVPVPLTGTLKINKSLNDYYDNPINSARNFTFNLTGGNLEPAGTNIIVVNDVEKVVPNLAFGHYVLSEVDPDSLYDNTINPMEFTLGPNSPMVTINATNRELNKGRITINKSVMNEAGQSLNDSTSFNIRVTGPGGYDQTKSFSMSTPAVFDDLVYGTYSIQEVSKAGYNASIVSDAVLSVTNRQVSVTVTNTVQSTHISIDKAATPASITGILPKAIDYLLTVINDGNADLHDVIITDTKIASLQYSTSSSGPWSLTWDGLLSIGETVYAKGTYQVTQDEVNAGNVHNIANVTGKSPLDASVNASDFEDVQITRAPAISLLKTASPATYSKVGDIITYSYKITNSGNVTLTGPFSVTDDKATVAPSADSVVLAPGAFITLTATHTITQADLDAGSITNVAQAHNGELNSNEDSVTVNAEQSPSLTIVKTVKNLTQAGPFDDLADLEEGETALFKVVVTNTGNIPLNNVMLYDDKVASGTAVTIEGVGPATFDLASKTNLGTMAPGASLTITYEYVTTVADVDEIIINTATASTMLGNEQVLSVMDDATISVTAIPLASFGITITKKVVNQTKGGTLADMANGFVGDVFTYVATITNTGDSLLSDVVLTDDKAPIGGLVIRNSDNAELAWADIGGKAGLAIGELQAGASISYTYRYTAVAADVDEVIINVATVNAVFKPESEYYEDVPLMKEAEATISIVGIPITGESNNSGTAVGLAMILAAIVALILRRRNRRNQMEL